MRHVEIKERQKKEVQFISYQPAINVSWFIDVRFMITGPQHPNWDTIVPGEGAEM